MDNKLVHTLAETGFTEVAHNVVLAGGPGTGKTHLATAIGVSGITKYGRRVRFYSTVDLVNALEQEKAQGKAGRNITSLDTDRQEKLTTWDDVYNIKARIEGEFTDLREKVAEDVSVSDEDAFNTSLAGQTRTKFVASRRTPFSYWRSRVYCALLAMLNQSREAFRQAIVDSDPNPAEMDDLFFGQP